ncbi:23S rRNA (cytidine(2498)-2'-O)-methyltransferase RlmM [Sediminicurvatus halobius]|uniref:23S rRNA (Cytidine(2498)-2'-O)-methyltransferase RlmM n=1 Tax=Sediminicurvatus halobius TaxID=2182432 RepID=A0A2U2MZX8_9GAMM|nr:23S rRNA (cytidine(2498)-2'-O)-methyltransferase RlmM [Spiribacter halobius]PWG62440.1 23S rRNA (cytidine(2498)-2'-O)-methyltransferase RlmM [Spiribacter halobius]UEX79880.1 23S rRNA (cytidine(2498)-2'-O)-methyltransferase RlmM [Spiribacter halobius]
MLLYCRPGFEKDCAAEITDACAAIGVAGYCDARPGQAFVTFHALPVPARPLIADLRWSRLVFARQLLALGPAVALPAADRATPIAETVVGLAPGFSDVWLEHPDSNDGRALSRLCRALRTPVLKALAERGVATDVTDAPRLHVFLDGSGDARVGLADPRNSAPWPLAIPRLRLPRAAPSRSTLKLDEALQTFLGATERERLLRPGMRAVDLGAAPGGWSWQLARRGLRVTAVDNGPMDPRLMAEGLVEHVRADGFRYRVGRPVDWLVCDMVEQPHRIAALVAGWLRRGDCHGAVCNLKLPMKRRHSAVREALARLEAALPPSARLGCKQLYHDREEVTAAVVPG